LPPGTGGGCEFDIKAKKDQEMARTNLVEMHGITKKFPGVLANDKTDFSVRAGEVHALLGENGAGKSTLMSVLSGLYRPDEGELFVKGEKVHFSSPKEAIEAGIGMVHQHFKLVSPFTVAENVLLGDASVSGVLNLARVEKRLDELTRDYGLRADPKAKIWQLSVGEQQRVEIIKMLYLGADILILDEPTAVLTPQEAQDLFRTLRHMAGQGKAVIVITHKLGEVMSVADRVTVLRAGRTIATVDKSETSKEELTQMMVGRSVMLGEEYAPAKLGRPRLEVVDLHAYGDKGVKALNGVSLSVRSGEILGIAGVAGNGQSQLAEVVTGLRKAESGVIRIGGADMTNRSPREIIDAGVAHIPADRLGMGLVPNLGAAENLILKDYRKSPIKRGMFLKGNLIKSRTDQLLNRFDVKTACATEPVKLLSGGNLQRLLLAREISAEPKLIVAVYPVRGLDIGAMKSVYNLLNAQKAAGAAILMISEDLEEIFRIADTIAVMFEGRITGAMPVGEADLEEIGLMMAGEAGQRGAA
jgi:ABC-type uncharacterized transport system ATPase subunit